MGRLATEPPGRSKGTYKPRDNRKSQGVDYQRTESIIFIPCTPGGELRKRLQELDDNFAKIHDTPRIRFVEMSGTKLKDSLSNRNPWGGRPCQRDDCWACCSVTAGKDSRCHTEGVTYSISCSGCKETGTTTEYTGETSRSLYQRGREHLKMLQKRDQNSVLWEHCSEEHNDEIQEFKIRVIQIYKTAFSRQVSEGVLIRYCRADITLNRKDEWNCSMIPNLAVEVGGVALQCGLKRRKMLDRGDRQAHDHVKKHKLWLGPHNTSNGGKMLNRGDSQIQENEKEQMLRLGPHNTNNSPQLTTTTTTHSPPLTPQHHYHKIPGHPTIRVMDPNQPKLTGRC